MEFFFKKVPGYHLTKKGLHHSFFLMSFLFRSDIKYFSSLCSFASVLTQNSILKNLFESYRKITVMRCFYSETADFEVTEERNS